MISEPVTTLVRPTMVPLCTKKDSGTRKPATEPSPALQVPSGEAVLALIMAGLSGGSYNGAGAGPTMDPEKRKSPATTMTKAVIRPMMVHFTIRFTLRAAAIVNSFLSVADWDVERV